MIDKKSRLESILVYSGVLVVVLAVLIPYVWMALGAFKPVPELTKVPPTFYIEQPTLNNFYDPLGSQGIANHVEGIFQRFKETAGGFLRYYFNSILVTGCVTIGSLVLASLAAFVLAKHHFPGRQIFFLIFLMSMMVPWQMTLIPSFLLMKQFGWIDTFQGLIVPALPKAFVVFFLRQYMMSLPDELLDSARIDGASELRIWWQIIVPLVRPALVAMGFFVMLAEWNNFVWPLIVIQGSSNRTLPLGLAVLNSSLTYANAPGAGGQTMGVLMAGAMLVSVPTLLLFLFFQKQFVRGIAMSGLKG